MNLSQQDLSSGLALLDQSSPDLAHWCSRFPLFDGDRAATNLRLLDEHLADRELLGKVIATAIQVADPDAALNNLERLFDLLERKALLDVIHEPRQRHHLLTLLGGSPFLTGILCRHNDYFSDLFRDNTIEKSCSENQMYADLTDLIATDADFAQLQAGLRQYKARQVLRIGARDLCGLATLEDVMVELSGLAAAALQRAYDVCSRLLQADYGQPLEQTAAGASTEAAMTVLGMGKFGGLELNFSSDIDLIYCYSSTHGESTGGKRGEQISLHRYFVKLAEMITRALHQVTEDGFVFRVDTRLRPEGNSGDLAVCVDGAEIYYESWGQSWERAAMLKARPVAGSIPLGDELLRRLKPFIFRRHLDFGMIEDIKVMKQKINASLDRQQHEQLNLKLGRGGIREIEFFIQALQLVNAGSRPQLQQRNSLKTIELLRREEMINTTEAQRLTDAYRFLRMVEHRIQMIQEQQTHSLPQDARAMEVLARRCGCADAAAFRTELDHHRQAVHAIFRDLFHSSDEDIAEVRPEVAFILSPDADVDLVKDLLEEKGFINPDAAYETLQLLRGDSQVRRMTRRSRRCLEKLAPLLLGEILDCANPGQALNNLDAFLDSIRARSYFFSLLVENPPIVRMLVALFGSSQLLSRIFIQRPELLDTLVLESYNTDVKSRDQMEQDLAEQLAQEEDFEWRLDALRRFRNEEFLRIALNDLHGEVSQEDIALQLSFLAEVCLEHAVRMAQQELVARFGAPFSEAADGATHQTEFSVIGMGKLGGGELNYHSDLDIIFIYQDEGQTRPVDQTDPERFRSLSNHEYFAKLAQRIITTLTLVTREGLVYKIDTRLRPSGNQGPLVTSLSAFRRYHLESAQPWERQAMTKARALTGSADFIRRIQQTIDELTFDRPLPEDMQAEIYRLRGRMEQEIARESDHLLNIKTGRGGMVDVEFIAQFLQLRHAAKVVALRTQNTIRILEILAGEQLLPQEDADCLVAGYKFLRQLENKLRLLYDQSINELSMRDNAFRKVARSLGYAATDIKPEQAFINEYRRVTEEIRQRMETYLNPATAPQTEGH
ncbi:MAG: bifunctional [glutamate--ammonia ligase]-adenylyl-L-tyrosine phosphorylase/[glutamate--ammonia-ligase] adenylyltransferase [Pelovirga sp.]